MRNVPPGVAERLQKLRSVVDAPTPLAKAFICPHCQVRSQQVWFDVHGSALSDGRAVFGPSPNLSVPSLMVSLCDTCRQPTIWYQDKIIFPASSTSPMPSPDMPEPVKFDYMEARAVFEKSARSAGGLLRVAFEKLLKHVGATKKSPNDAIGELVQKGLVLGQLQQAMDSLRIFSNQSVHDGFVKLEDQAETVSFLFGLINYIVEQMITRPKEINALYATLPATKVAEIEKRDKKT